MNLRILPPVLGLRHRCVNRSRRDELLHDWMARTTSVVVQIRFKAGTETTMIGG